MFSSRLPAIGTQIPLAHRLGSLQMSGVRIHDLTVSNPTQVGISYPPGIAQSFARVDGVVYRPDPRGLVCAREAIAAMYLEDQGIEIATEQVVLTASTSEAYSFLFKLLADPGDEVLVPVPGYPLFDHLATLEGLVVKPCPSWFDGRWQVDLDAVKAAISSRTRAVVVVSPNNPTGAYLTRDTYAGLVDLCQQAGLALISDEVFTDYPRAERVPADIIRTVASRDDVLCFSLGGLSKALGLPGMKLSWILVNGPRDRRQEALDGLEFIADNYLSVGTPVQRALPQLLQFRKPVQSAIRKRIATNLEHASRFFGPESPVSLVPAEAGWYQILRVPNVATEETLALNLLEKEHVHVQPGYFYDFPREGFLVTSLLVPPETWAVGLQGIAQQVDTAIRRM